VHRWLGLWAGAWLVWLGLTGSVLAVAPAVERWLHPDWHAVPVRAACSAETRRQLLELRYPNLPIRRWEPATTAGCSERVLLGPDLAVFVDPADGRVLGEQSLSSSLAARVLKLHTLAEPALPYVVLACVVVLGSGLSVAPLRLRVWRQPLRLQALDLHRRLGWVAMLPLLGSMLTGAALVEYKVLDRWLRGAAAPAAPRAGLAPVVDLDALVQAAARSVPRGAFVRWEFPGKPGEPFVARMVQPGELNPKGRTFVYLDPATTEVLLVEDPLQDRWGVRLLQGVYRVHAGYYPGGAGVLALLGLCPAGLWIGGWLLRRRRLNALEKSTRRQQGGGD
jgi:uncharacterized iron-regulated membrane protein